jgi:hypothetical protein
MRDLPENPVPERPARDQAPPRPWGFWLLIVLTVLYLGWRAVQGIVWVMERLT